MAILKQLVGHGQILERFQKSFQRNRLASTYLFVGREGIGKRMFAIGLAQSLLCRRLANHLEACGECRSCQQVAALTHPDLILVQRPPEKNFIPVELFVGDREHRRREGLCHDISLTPFEGTRKIAIIDDADFLNAESANALLKTLEEPPADSMMILIGTSEHQQLPTILSRSQIVRFQALDPGALRAVLARQSLSGQVELEKLVEVADGSVARAMQLDHLELFEFREQVLNQLATGDPAANGLAKVICDFAESTSREASIRRDLLKLVADFALQLYRQSLHAATNADDKAPRPDLNRLADQLIENMYGNLEDPAEPISECLIRTLEFQRHVGANLSMANIVPAWLNDLGAIGRREKSCI